MSMLFCVTCKKEHRLKLLSYSWAFVSFLWQLDLVLHSHYLWIYFLNHFYTTSKKVLYFSIYTLLQFLKQGRYSVSIILWKKFHCSSWWSSWKEERTQPSKILQFQTWGLVAWGMFNSLLPARANDPLLWKLWQWSCHWASACSLLLFHFLRWFILWSYVLKWIKNV